MFVDSKWIGSIEPAAIVVAFPTEVTSPVKLALVVTLPAVKPDAVPVILVPTNAVGVPKSGVVKVGLTARTGAPVPVAVVQTGAVEAPPPTNISVVAPAATTSTAEAALPITKPPSANVDTPVPP